MEFLAIVLIHTYFILKWLGYGKFRCWVKGFRYSVSLKSNHYFRNVLIPRSKLKPKYLQNLPEYHIQTQDQPYPSPGTAGWWWWEVLRLSWFPGRESWWVETLSHSPGAEHAPAPTLRFGVQRPYLRLDRIKFKTNICRDISVILKIEETKVQRNFSLFFILFTP